ncbi:MAG: PAS domain S-box protein [Anaerolineales bacterium]|nr:PAS domain S-box protein [Anaerolineales bacterium]
MMIEQALRRSEEHCQLLLNSVVDYVYTVHIKGGKVVSTTHGPGCAAVTGYTPEDYNADPNLWIRMVHKHDRKAVLAQAQAIRSGQSATPLEHRIYHKDGTIRWVRNTPGPRYDLNGRIESYDGLIVDITERKRAEEALRESEQKYRTLFETAIDALFLEKLDGSIVDCNTAACKMFGYSKEEMLNLTVGALVPAEVASTLPGLIQKIRSEGKACLETTNRKKDGQLFPCEVNIRPIKIAGEEFVIAYIHDLTTRKQAELALRQKFEAETRIHAIEATARALENEVNERKETESKLKRRALQLALINEIGGQVATVLELQEVLERAAQLVQASFNYHHVGLFTCDESTQELVMRARAGSFANLYPSSHRLKLNQGMVGWAGARGKKLLANDVSLEPHYVNLYPEIIPTLSELSVPLKVGERVVGVLDVQSPQLNAFDENDVLVIETLADEIAIAIENARLYEALRDSEARYREVSEMVSDLAFALDVDADGRLALEWATDALTRLTGYTAVELRHVGGWQEIVYPDDQDRARQLMDRTMSGLSAVGEFRIVSKNGQVRWLRMYTRPIWNQDRVVRINGAAQDISEAKSFEVNMLHTERMAAMGQMAAVLAHEIKNPLQAIRSNLELVMDFDLNPNEKEECLSFCRQEIDRLSELTRHILDYARPSQENQPLPCSLAELLSQVMTIVQDPLAFAHIKLKIDLPSQIPPIVVRPDRIKQVFINLILNAIDAMPQGGEAHIAARLDQSNLIITLTNSGSQIHPQDFPHLFEPFFTTKPNSTGLGLFVTQGIIEQHGGTIEAENLPDNAGVCFRICLPLTPFNEVDNNAGSQP